MDSKIEKGYSELNVHPCVKSILCKPRQLDNSDSADLFPGFI